MAATGMLPVLAAAAGPAPFNAALRAHASAHPEWELRGLVTMLYGWAERFNAHFALQLTLPAITVQPLPRHKLGHYRPAPNGFGVDDEVAVNRSHLPLPPAVVLSVLLHEMVHQWQHRHGCPDRGAHNLQFRRKCAELGIPCDERGCAQDIVADGPFARLLQAHGIEVPTDAFAPPGPVAPRPRRTPWRCGCTTVHCDSDLTARCERCGQPFLRLQRAARR